jgi:hypothetical protein
MFLNFIQGSRPLQQKRRNLLALNDDTSELNEIYSNGVKEG